MQLVEPVTRSQDQKKVNEGMILSIIHRGLLRGESLGFGATSIQSTQDLSFYNRAMIGLHTCPSVSDENVNIKVVLF